MDDHHRGDVSSVPRSSSILSLETKFAPEMDETWSPFLVTCACTSGVAEEESAQASHGPWRASLDALTLSPRPDGLLLRLLLHEKLHTALGTLGF